MSILSAKLPRFVRKGFVAQGRMRTGERVVGFRRHGVALKPVLQSSMSKGAPNRARETLSVLFVLQVARCAPEAGFTKIQATGAGTPDTVRVAPPVRAQGIGGARRNGSSLSGRINHKKSCEAWIFYGWRDGTPAKPGFLRSRLPGISCPPKGDRAMALQSRPNSGRWRSKKCAQIILTQSISYAVFFSVSFWTP
jgi:hypothetical protein